MPCGRDWEDRVICVVIMVLTTMALLGAPQCALAQRASAGAGAPLPPQDAGEWTPQRSEQLAAEI